MIWRESINDYLRPLHLEEVPDELGPIGRLHAHTQATDPDRFVVATVPGDGQERIVGFGSAVERGSLWFLSMLFVRPEAQGQGLGRALLERILPAAGAASARWRPRSTASSRSRRRCTRGYGIVPRMPAPRPARA